MHLRREISISSWHDCPDGTIDAWICNTRSVDLGQLALNVTLSEIRTIEEDTKYRHVNGRLSLKQSKNPNSLLTDMHLTKTDNTGFGIVKYTGQGSESHLLLDMLNRIDHISNQACCSE